MFRIISRLFFAKPLDFKSLHANTMHFSESFIYTRFHRVSFLIERPSPFSHRPLFTESLTQPHAKFREAFRAENAVAMLR